MRKLILAINVSLDGFADHTAAVAADDELHEFIADLLDETDFEVSGRVTSQLMAEYWPHAHEDPNMTSGKLKVADKFNGIPKIVFSRTLQKAELSKAKLIEITWSRKSLS